MKYQKGDLFELPHGYGFVIFKRVEGNFVYFYCLNPQRETWTQSRYFKREASKLG
jgi:hypothetical protein